MINKKIIGILVCILFIGASVVSGINIQLKNTSITSSNGWENILNDGNRDSGLVAYWSFDDGTAHDDSGNNHNGIVYGASVVNGISGNAFRFDGDDDYIDFGDDPDLDITGNITIALWFKTNTSQLGVLVNKLDNEGQDNGYCLNIGGTYPDSGENINYWLAKNSNDMRYYDTAQTSSTFTDDTWYFLTAIYTPDGISRPKIYIDALEQSVNIGGIPLSSIGASPGYNFKIAEYSPESGYFNFNGTLDEVRLYDRALTIDEIQYLYDNPGGVDIVYIDDDYSSSTPGWQIDHFDKIQDGIDAVDIGGTVYVYNGTYYENVVINKDGIQLLGENKYTTIIDANDTGEGIAIPIPSNYMTFSNFTIRNANGSGIIFNDGVSGRNCKHNTIADCIIYNSSTNYGNPGWDWKDGHGIIFIPHDGHIEDNKILNCEIYNNDLSGISIFRSAYGTVIDNQIIGCKVYNNGFQGWLHYQYKAGIAVATGYGVIQNTIISQCEIYDNAGDGLYHHMGDEISDSCITNNTIYNNNGYGINLTGNFDNALIYHNNLIDNYQNAYDDGTSAWDSGYPSGGNYWSDYTGVDGDGDGIGDTPYNISGGDNQDLYPLMYPFGPPYADFEYIVEEGIVEFNASKSGDYNGFIVSYDWDFGDGTTGNGMIVSHTYSETGFYDVTLTVTDNDGYIDDITKTIEIEFVNHPPNKPTIDGPITGKPGVDYTYYANTTDPDGDQVYYKWNWGDGSYSDWLGPFNSGVESSASHSWSQGNFEIKVKARDTRGLESEWSDPFPITMPRDKVTFNSLLLSFIEQFPLLERLLNLFFAF